MEIYLVGGAVRDRLLGRDASDRDYVVVGAAPETAHRTGLKPVGKDFPVFLHPRSGEEYALARTEGARAALRLAAGFTFDTSADVTLEDDLRRRDLTINAMAEDESGRLVDPFGGARDLEARVLRARLGGLRRRSRTSAASSRFAARYAPLGFMLAPETQALLRAMVVNGEVDHLVAERVWAETRRAPTEPQPSAFLRVLRDCGSNT